jgi:hypothetical protein
LRVAESNTQLKNLTVPKEPSIRKFTELPQKTLAEQMQDMNVKRRPDTLLSHELSTKSEWESTREFAE